MFFSFSHHSLQILETVVHDNPRRSAVSEIFKPPCLAPTIISWSKITFRPHSDIWSEKRWTSWPYLHAFMHLVAATWLAHIFELTNWSTSLPNKVLSEYIHISFILSHIILKHQSIEETQILQRHNPIASQWSDRPAIQHNGHESQTWVKCIIVLDSNTFLCSTDLAWSNSIEPTKTTRSHGTSHVPKQQTSSVTCTKLLHLPKTMTYLSQIWIQKVDSLADLKSESLVRPSFFYICPQIGLIYAIFNSCSLTTVMASLAGAVKEQLGDTSVPSHSVGSH